MAIVRKKVVAGIEGAPSTHFPNLTTMNAEDSGQEMLNHKVWNTLIDPEDIDEGGSTHFKNLEKDTKETRRQNASAVKSVAKSSKSVKADVVDLETDSFHDADMPDADGDPDQHLGEDPDAGVLADADDVENPQFMDNEEDPAAGYLTDNEFDDDEVEAETEELPEG